jgi:hypothetical protein
MLEENKGESIDPNVRSKQSIPAGCMKKVSTVDLNSKKQP